MNKRNKEQSIYVFEMFGYVLSQWKSIIIGAIIIAVLFTGFQVVFGKTTVSTSSKKTDSEEESEQIDIDDITSLTEAEKIDVENALSDYNNILEYRTLRDDVTSTTNRHVIQYLLKVDNTQVNNNDLGDAILYSLKQYVTTGGLTKDLTNAGISDSAEGELYNTIAFSCVDASENTSSAGSDSYMVYPFTISYKSITENTNNILSDAIEEKIEKQISDYDSISDTELIVLDEYTGSYEDSTSLKEKKTYNDTIYDISKQFAAITENFSDEQARVFNELAGEKVLRVSSSAEKNTKTVSVKLSKKLLLEAILIGLVAMIIILMFKYGLTKKLRENRALSELYGLYSIGDLTSSKVFSRKTVADKEKLDLIIANIKAICAKEEISRLSIVTTDKIDNVQKEIFDTITSKLAEGGIEVAYTGDVFGNVAGFETMISTGAVVISAKTMATKIKTLDKVAELVCEHELKVVGSVCG